MIYEVPCDTKDWSNDAENSALHLKNKLHLKYIQIENSYIKFVIIFHNLSIFTVFLVK